MSEQSHPHGRQLDVADDEWPSVFAGPRNRFLIHFAHHFRHSYFRSSPASPSSSPVLSWFPVSGTTENKPPPSPISICRLRAPIKDRASSSHEGALFSQLGDGNEVAWDPASGVSASRAASEDEHAMNIGMDRFLRL
ncbi:hypothetical protein HPB47_005342 [Ixodes persulcatus]|uniref:Uncharacterized protein n=1 Tax=Ixodes persulcatus TaxID=34615 RepID=A0AC60PE36_IXOPE|nr:hypothetical protein HPB47_005342 [Ixodes persulcatus]